MIIGEVMGTVVASHKHYKVGGKKLLLIQPLDLAGQAEGRALLAVDSVGAGVGDRVLVVIEGRCAALAAERPQSPIDAAVVGVVDSVSLG